MFRACLLNVMLCCVILVALIGFSAAQFIQDVGDSCQLASGGTGVCRDFNDCDLNLLANEQPQPAICAQRGEFEAAIVCCPNSGGAPPRPPPRAGLSISKQKCREYNDIKQSVVPTILGGDDVKSITQYPHMALLGYGNPPEWKCGGTLISDQYILTAAHCLNAARVPVTTAHLGFLDRRNRNEFNTLQEFRIVQIHKHPTRKAPKQYADIALLKLDRPVEYTQGVVPACLHEDYDFPVNKAQAVGWGSLTSGAESGSDILQKVQIFLKNYTECANNYPANMRKIPQGIKDETQFCAGNDGKDTCQGDSGGPLQIHDTSGMAKIIGITSFGQDCGLAPGVYTRVSHYVPWIESIVWP